ncbi:MAG: FAD-dependent oxidoreductase [Deltaproteobacteria bacterium]|nr:MAG: FAD-dependent oxidoreductase [Deltaproteobacteria bacterium]
MTHAHAPLAVVGGGLAGLIAAATLARGGREVHLFEGSRLGGRGRSEWMGEFAVNLGPHALYVQGLARRALLDLGVSIRGGRPPLSTLGLVEGELHPLPFTPMAAASTPLLTAGERFALARWVAGLALLRPESLRGRSVSQWLAPLAPRVRRVLGALVRVSTYCADLERFDAGAAAAQLQRALHGVLYLDGGWQSLVDGLRSRCEALGVVIHEHAAVRRVEGGLVTTDAGELGVSGAVLAVSPKVAHKLTGHPRLAEALDRATPVRAACLDLVLRGDVDPARRFALGVDRPVYVSEHSSVARFGPPGFTVVHAAVYGGQDVHGGTDPGLLRNELEEAMDLLYGDWRARQVHDRFLPAMTVAHDLPRPGEPRCPGRLAADLWVAGDWVQGEHLLLDAAVESALAAAAGLLARKAVA